MPNNDEFYIQLEKERVELAPTNEQDYKKLINAIINITGVTIVNSTSRYATDKERTEAILKMAGQLSTDAVKHAFVIIVNESVEAKARGDA